MTPDTAPIPGRQAVRPALAGLATLALLAAIGPVPAAEAGIQPPLKAGGHSCCCGSICRMGCCDAKPEPTGGGRPVSPPASAADVASLLDEDPSTCVGPKPCGGDADAPPSLTSPRERPAALASPSRFAIQAGRSPLPCSVDRLRPALPGDLPEKPPRSTPAGPLA